jgi:hypothetical protein
MREIYPVKYYSKEGFVERKIEINEEDLQEIIEDYLLRNAEFDFDEVEIVNNRPINICFMLSVGNILTQIILKKMEEYVMQK